MKQAAAQDKRKATIPPSPSLSPSLPFSPSHLDPLIIFFISLMYFFLLTLQPTPQTHTSATSNVHINAHTHFQTHSQGTAVSQTNRVCIYWVGHLWSCQLIRLKVCPVFQSISLRWIFHIVFLVLLLLVCCSFYGYIFTAVCHCKMEDMLKFTLSVSKSETNRNPNGYF